MNTLSLSLSLSLSHTHTDTHTDTVRSAGLYLGVTPNHTGSGCHYKAGIRGPRVRYLTETTSLHHSASYTSTTTTSKRHETQTLAAVPASLAHHHGDAGGHASASRGLPVRPELPVPGRLHEQHPGSRSSRGGPEPGPLQAPENPQTEAVVQGSDETFCIGLASSWLPARPQDL